MKARGLASPDLGDCLAMSFSVTVQPKPTYREPDPWQGWYEDRVRNGGGQWV
jgi:hypothetical protein